MSIIGIQDQIDTNNEFIGCLENEQHHEMVRRHVYEITITMAGWQ